MTGMGPLAGRRVMVTRAAGQARGLIERLRALGAEPVAVPLVEVLPLAARAEILAGLERLARHRGPRWAVLSSANAVRLVADAGGWGSGRPPGLSVACVGSETAAALRHAGVEPDLSPATFVAESLAEALAARGLRGARVWLPAAEGARPGLAERLRREGAEVETLTLYRSVLPAGAPEALARALAAGPVNAVLFTSGSTVAHFARALGNRPFPPGAVAACIGPVTAEAARRAGFPAGPVAAEATAEALAGALAAHYSAVA